MAAVIDKSTTTTDMMAVVRRVLDGETGLVSPTMAPLVEGLPGRTPVEALHRLVPLAGHARIWKELMDWNLAEAPSYRALAERTGLSINTVKNYRATLLPALRVLGISEPSLAQLRSFAQRCAPLLRPIVTERLRSPRVPRLDGPTA